MASEPAASPASARPPLVARLLDGSAPEAIRLSAARGALPIPLQDLVFVQIHLLGDPLPAIAEAARASLAAVDDDAALALLKDPACEPRVLDHFVQAGLEGAALEAAIAHPSLPDETLEALASSGDAVTLNLIVTNEVRIIRDPRLLGLLRGNANLDGDNRRRLAELERDFVGKEPLEVRRAAAVPAAAEEAAPAPAEETPPDDSEPPPPIMTPEEEAAYEEALRRTPTFLKIMKMNSAEKVQLAMKGNAEERAILVRDTAKMVALQVLKSPKLSENEITSFANMRNVHEDILRTIATKRDWTKSYTVAHALVRNPKTPSGITLQFLPRLGTRDLKIVAGDKNIAELVRRQARNLFVARTQPPKKLKKAH